MSIKELLQKIKPFYNLLIVLVIASILIALIRISANEESHAPIKIENSGVGQSASVIQAISTTTDQVIGSKSGKKYYYPWCGTLKRVKPENQVKFISVAEARSAGYTPAANCKGLK